MSEVSEVSEVSIKPLGSRLLVCTVQSGEIASGITLVPIRVERDKASPDGLQVVDRADQSPRSYLSPDWIKVLRKMLLSQHVAYATAGHKTISVHFNCSLKEGLRDFYVSHFRYLMERASGVCVFDAMVQLRRRSLSLADTGMGAAPAGYRLIQCPGGAAFVAEPRATV